MATTQNLKLSKDKLNELALALIQQMHEKKASNLFLKGDLGTGKTTLTKHIAQALGISEQISSPTFVFEKIYTIPPELRNHKQLPAFKELVHVDLYRLENEPADFLNLDEKLANPDTFVVIEWPENVFDLDSLPADTLLVEIEHTPALPQEQNDYQNEERTFKIYNIIKNND